MSENEPITKHECNMLRQMQCPCLLRMEADMERLENRTNSAIERITQAFSDYLKEERSRSHAIMAQTIGIVVTLAILILQWVTR